MNNHKILPLLIFFAMVSLSDAEQPASVASIEPNDLVEYASASDAIKRVIEASLKLTSQDLAYTFGSASPSKGGMDCSGTVCCMLKSLNIPKVPRSSYTIYHWANDHGNLAKLENVHSPNHPALRQIEPGDLVFWEGTYAVEGRTPPISHVMVYLGILKKDGEGVLFGASSGRRFRGKKIHGVSVFDFKVPSATSKARLVAFGPIPGIREVAPAKLEKPKKVVKTKPSVVPIEPKPANAPSESQETQKLAEVATETRVEKPAPVKLSDRLKKLKSGNKPFKKLFSGKNMPNFLKRSSVKKN